MSDSKPGNWLLAILYDSDSNSPEKMDRQGKEEAIPGEADGAADGVPDQEKDDINNSGT